MSLYWRPLKVVQHFHSQVTKNNYLKATSPLSNAPNIISQCDLPLMQRWLSFWKVLTSVKRNLGALSLWFLVTFLTKGLLPRLLSLAGRPFLGGVLVVLPFKNDGGHCVIGDLQCFMHFLVTFPRSVPWHNPVSEIYRQLFWLHDLVFALTCTANHDNKAVT